MERKILIAMVGVAATALFFIATFGLSILRLYYFPPDHKTTVVYARIENDTMYPSKIAVKEGKLVDLRLKADRQVDFRVMGLVQTRIPPHDGVSVKFGAKNTGRYEIRDDRNKERIGMLLVKSRE